MCHVFPLPRLAVFAVYASAVPVVNYFPRVFLGALVVFAGFGFIYDNVVLTWKKMPRAEYACIWLIAGITALTQLLYAVLAGILLAFAIFVFKYGRRGAVKTVLSGSEYQSRVVRSYRDQQKVQHLGKLLVIVELCRYLFFGSRQAFAEHFFVTFLAGRLWQNITY